MNKKSLLSLMLLCFACLGLARAEVVEVGEQTGTNAYLPTYSFYKYSLTQQIYTAEEIGMAGTINSIAFKSTGQEKTRTLDIYLVATDKEAFSGATDWIAVTASDLVYSGSVTFTAGEWITLELTNAFEYDGQSNLAVIVDDNTGSYSSGLNCGVFAGTSQSIRVYSDGTNYDPTAPTYTGTVLSVKNILQLDITPASGVTCDKPESIEVSNVTTDAATVTWEGGSGTYNLQCKLASESWDDIGTLPNLTLTSYNFTELQPATKYDVRVQSVCDEATSGWKSTSFTTACGAITTFPWTEDFEGFAVGNLVDPCWVNEHIEGDGTQIFKVYSSTSGMGGNTTHLLQLPDMTGGTLTKLVLPEMTLPANYEFSIDVYRSNSTYNSNNIYEGIRVYASTDGEIEGATELAFIPRQYNTGNEVIPEEEAIGWYNYEIPIGMSGTCYIILRGESQYCTSTYMDNFAVKAMPTCFKPTGLAYADVTAHTASLSWTSDAAAWQICINDDEENLIDVEETSYTLTGLDEATTYTAKVRTDCGEDGYSEWSNVVSFTTPIACPAPTGLAVSEITGHTAKLNWNGSADSYIVSYRTAAYAEGIYEEFNTSGVPSGWTRYSGLVDYVITDSIALTTVTSYWNTTTYALGQYNMKLNIYGTSCRYWLVSPEFTLDQNLSFDLALTAYNSANPIANDTLQADDRFIVLIYANDAWTILREWNNSGSEYVYNAIPATGENVTIDLTDYIGQNVKLAFYGESTASGGDNDLHIDNVFCGTPIPAGEWMTANTDTTTYTLTGLNPEMVYEVKVASDCPGEIGHETAIVSFTTDVACPAPTALAVANITPDSADLSWTSGADAWEIEIADNQEPPVITTWPATTNPFTVPGLFPETTYSVRVRANCGDEGYSEWSAPVTFTTLIACPVPEDLVVSNLTYNKATLAWTAYSDSYILNWAYGENHTLLTEDFANGIPVDWTNDTIYPFEAVTDSITGNIYMMSSNAGVSSSISEVSFTVTYPAAGYVEFDAQCMGEGTSWDVCRLLIDDETVFSKGANGEQWDHYCIAVAEGEHTFTWRYSKDGSVNPTGDHFAVDNINMYWVNVIALEPITTEDTEYTFTGLTPETRYYVTVTGVCGDEQTEASEMVEFTTPVPSQTIVLTTGFNWVSSYMEITLADLQDALVEALPATAGIKIQSQSNGNTTYNGTRWRGQLNSIDLSQMYLIEVPIDCQITLVGMPVNPAEHPVTIHNGANWIAFPLSESMTLTNAFAGFVINGDKVQSQANGNSTYTNRWRGQLTTLVPGQGYIYSSEQTDDRTFIFPSNAK